jgi:hypothetical protein
MSIINSISPIWKVSETNGSHPVFVLCEGVEDYVCKYSTGTPSEKLFNEFIAGKFLQLWKLRVPEFCFVNINQAHIPTNLVSNIIQPRHFNAPCFGSKYYDKAKELDRSLSVFIENPSELKKISNKDDFLKIGAFDLWTSNEDRNFNNYNLLLNFDEKNGFFMPIDHEKCFNSSCLERGLYQLSDNESILNSELCKLLFKPGKPLNQIVANVEQECYICIQECKNSLDAILNEIPSTWGIDIAAKRDLLINSIFAATWIEETITNFKQYLETGLH